MRLEPGVRVGVYEITGVLGAGGMGEVYRAHDTTLKRDVALKALPERFSRDADRIARFQREAEVLASLNHPNIAGIYSLVSSFDSQFLVLELVEGPTLAERLARGPMPAAEALRLAERICEAIEAAHGKNVIHRDLKPANIKLTPDGGVKLLDFGLARIFEASMMSGHTLPTLMTIGHAVLGTAAYMSPEQARGKAVDKRTDIWAFGCVLFEMLTGRQAFGGETVSDTIAAILNRGPEMSWLPSGVPPVIAKLIERCLEKDARVRLHDIADARLEIADAGAPARRSGPRKTPRRLARWAAIPLACLLSFSAGVGVKNSKDDPAATWSGTLLVGGSTVGWGPRVSPDGKRVAFIVMVDAQSQVAIMDAESGTWDVLTRRREAGVRIHASWSPDGSKIYFTRGSTQGANVFSIPAVGGEERLVLDNAYFPEPLPDGSLLITRPNETGQPQLHRFWPQGNRLEPLPAVLLNGPLDPPVPVRAFADGKQAAFYGRALTPAGMDVESHLHILDLEAKTTMRLDSSGLEAPLQAVSTDRGGFALADAPAGDLHRLVAIHRGGGALPKVLLTLTGRFSGVDIDAAGTIFVDQQNNTLEVLKISPGDGSIQRLARSETYALKSHTVELGDGRVIVPGMVSGRPRLMLERTNKISTPLVDTPEETAGPLTLAGSQTVAFMIGSGEQKAIGLASLPDQRIVGRIPVPEADAIVQLAASVDGGTLYYVAGGSLWQVPAAGGVPEKVSPAASIAVDPNGAYLVLQRDGPNLSAGLFRRSLADGSEERIAIDEAVRIGDMPLAANAVDKAGRILITTALDATTWYWQVSILDLATGRSKRIPTDFPGDILYAGWTSDGGILAAGVNTEGSIWRFRPVKN